LVDHGHRLGNFYFWLGAEIRARSNSPLLCRHPERNERLCLSPSTSPTLWCGDGRPARPGGAKLRSRSYHCAHVVLLSRRKPAKDLACSARLRYAHLAKDLPSAGNTSLAKLEATEGNKPSEARKSREPATCARELSSPCCLRSFPYRGQAAPELPPQSAAIRPSRPQRPRQTSRLPPGGRTSPKKRPHCKGCLIARPNIPAPGKFALHSGSVSKGFPRPVAGAATQ